MAGMNNTVTATGQKGLAQPNNQSLGGFLSAYPSLISNEFSSIGNGIKGLVSTALSNGKAGAIAANNPGGTAPLVSLPTASAQTTASPAQNNTGGVGVAGGKPPAPAGYGYNADGSITNNAGQAPLVASNYTPPAPLVSTPSTQTTGTGPNGTNTVAPLVASQQPNNQTVTENNNSGGSDSAPDSLSGALSGLNSVASSNPDVESAKSAISTLSTQYASDLQALSQQPGLSEQDVAGRQGALYNAYSQRLSALQAQLGTAQQQQSTQVGAASTAVSALAPVSQYGALTSPVTGQAISGGSSGSVLPTSAQTLVNTLAQQVQSGQMTQSQALSELTAYGPAGVSALTQALGPTFNTNSSNNSASTTQAGQQIQTSMAAANQSLGTLQSLYQSLPGFSTTGIPGLNSLTNSMESILGSSQLSSYNAALSDARAQLEGVLTATGSATPTDAASMASTYLPDNMTPSQLAKNIATVQALMQQKASSFQGSGSQGSTTGSAITNSSGQVVSANF